MGALPVRAVKSYAPLPEGILHRAGGALRALALADKRARDARTRFLVLAGEIGLVRANALLQALKAR